MNVYDYFAQCEKEMPGKCTTLRRTSFALRRAGVNTMETLCDMRTQTPEALASMRDIGPQRLGVIHQLANLFEKTQKQA